MSICLVRLPFCLMNDIYSITSWIYSEARDYGSILLIIIYLVECLFSCRVLSNVCLKD